MRAARAACSWWTDTSWSRHAVAAGCWSCSARSWSSPRSAAFPSSRCALSILRAQLSELTLGSHFVRPSIRTRTRIIKHFFVVRDAIHFGCNFHNVYEYVRLRAYRTCSSLARTSSSQRASLRRIAPISKRCVSFFAYSRSNHSWFGFRSVFQNVLMAHLKISLLFTNFDEVLYSSVLQHFYLELFVYIYIYIYSTRNTSN